jgi:hypothetical protein
MNYMTCEAGCRTTVTGFDFLCTVYSSQRSIRVVVGSSRVPVVLYCRIHQYLHQLQDTTEIDKIQDINKLEPYTVQSAGGC